jgi:hypothetical protein
MAVSKRLLSGTILAIVLGLLALPGCGGARPAEVEGTVTYDGQPIPAGAISFVAAAGQGPSGGGTILDGKYQVQAKVGLMPGPYRVEIRWAKPTGRQYRGETGAMLSVTEEGLPAKYNDQSELKADLKPGPNTVPFDLPKK